MRGAAITAASNAGGARLAAERTSGWTRHLRLTPLPSWAYAAGKVLTGAALALMAALALSRQRRPGLSCPRPPGRR